MNYKLIFDVEIDEILMATQNRIFLEILIQVFDTLFDNTLQEGPKLKLLRINIIQI